MGMETGSSCAIYFRGHSKIPQDLSIAHFYFVKIGEKGRRMEGGWCFTIFQMLGLDFPLHLGFRPRVSMGC